jgi:alpha-D-xyloside xylohydrolase
MGAAITPALLLALCAVRLTSGQFLTQLDAFGDDSIRVRVAPPGGAITEPPLQALMEAPPPLRTAVAGDGLLQLSNGNLRVVLDPATALLTATRASDGAVLLRQTALTFSAPAVAVSRLGSVAATVAFAGTPGEKVYGLGEHRTGTVQQLPYSKVFAESQDYSKSHGGDVSIPWYVSSLGYGFVWNSPAMGNVSLTEAALSWSAEATLGVDLWITTTPADFDPASGVSPYAPLLRRYVDAVGHAPPMPYYATGFVQCKDRYRNQSQLLDVARGYVARQLPISTIVIDWQHYVAQGDWHFNPLCWPDPQGMVDELQTYGIELMVTFWPFQSRESRYWQEFLQDGYLVNKLNATGPTSYDGGDQFLVDDTNPVVRASIFDKFWDGYGQYGIKTIWIDAAEPEGLDSSAANTWRFSAGTGAEVGPAWVQAHTKTFAEGFATKGIAPSDYFILPRSAWAGSWRYSAALWSGDIQSTFEELAIQVKVLQGVMMSGPALWTTDVSSHHILSPPPLSLSLSPTHPTPPPPHHLAADWRLLGRQPRGPRLPGLNCALVSVWGLLPPLSPARPQGRGPARQ